MNRTRRSTALCGVLSAVLLAASCGLAPHDDPKGPGPATPSPVSSQPAAPVSEPPEPAPLPAGASGTPRPGIPDPQRVDGQDATAVGRAALTVMWTFDTALDVSQHDASLRALPYLTPEYGEEVRNTPRRAAPGADWNLWSSHHAYTTAELTPADDAGRPADTAAQSVHTFVITATPHGDNGWTGPAVTATAFVQLTRAGSQPWKVAAVQVQ